jgi:hypothetical protein
MPYATTWEAAGIVWKYSGAVTDSDILEANYEFYGDDRSDAATYQIVDGLGITHLDLSEDLIERLAIMDAESSRRIRNVKVALIGTDAKVRASFQAYVDASQEHGGNWAIALFADVDSARRWIASFSSI